MEENKTKTWWQRNLYACEKLRIPMKCLCKKEIIYKWVPSFNSHPKNNYLNENIKYIVVGTLTPFDGRENGYFYAAKNNSQIKMIDYAFENKKLQEKYELLSNNKKNCDVIDEIISILNDRKIAFLDVIKEGFSPNQIGCAKDELIYPFILDKESFRKLIQKNKNVNFICNSRFSEEALVTILSSIKKDMTCDNNHKIYFCPQYGLDCSGYSENKGKMFREVISGTLSPDFIIRR